MPQGGAVCQRAIDQGKQVKAYRGKDVAKPRTGSEQLIGRLFDPQAVLDDLRERIAMDTILGIPAGPNSGLSVRLA